MSEANSLNITITDHAYDRAKERLGLKRESLNRVAVKAFEGGKKHGDIKGTLHRFITKLWFEHKNCNNVRIYGENIFFFCNTTLITLYRLENKLIKHTKHCK